jgi:hypothetical protein
MNVGTDGAAREWHAICCAHPSSGAPVSASPEVRRRKHIASSSSRETAKANPPATHSVRGGDSHMAKKKAAKKKGTKKKAAKKKK